MSGNTTQTGYQAAEGEFGPASASALAILFFFVGAFAGALLVWTPWAPRRRRFVFAFVAATLAAIIGLTQLGLLSTGFGIAIINLAIGIFNSALAGVGAQAVRLPFVTGTLGGTRWHLCAGGEAGAADDSQGPWEPICAAR